MVCLAERHKLSAKSSMAVAPERTTTTTAAGKPLHNFDMPWLRWGSQRYLRCMKVTNPAAGSVSGGSHRRSEGFGLEDSPIAAVRREARRRKSLRVGGGLEEDGEGIAAVREKLLGDLKVAAAKMKDAIFRDGVAAEDDEEDDDNGAAAVLTGVAVAAAAEEEEEAEARPWNLRTRRAACKAPASEDRKVVSSSSSPEKTKPATKREKFSPVLSKKEIEADFMAFLGHKPARRPKKRPRIVQRQLDFLVPGFLLTEITTETYKVSENPETGKR